MLSTPITSSYSNAIDRAREISIRGRSYDVKKDIEILKIVFQFAYTKRQDIPAFLLTCKAWNRIKELFAAYTKIQLPVSARSCTLMACNWIGFFPQVTSISLQEKSQIIDEDLNLLLEKCPNVKQLELNTRVRPSPKTDKTTAVEDRIAGLKHLGELDLAWDDYSPRFLKKLSEFSSLSSLKLSRSYKRSPIELTNEFAPTLAKFRNLTTLLIHRANCREFPISDDLAARLKVIRFQRCENVRWDFLKKCNQLVAAFFTLNRPVFDEAALGFLNSSASSLETIELADTGITDAGLKQLLNFSKLKVLKLVRFYQITAAGIASLAKMPQLISLEVKENKKVTDFTWLHQFKWLRELVISSADVTCLELTKYISNRQYFLSRVLIQSCASITEEEAEVLQESFKDRVSITFSGLRRRAPKRPRAS